MNEPIQKSSGRDHNGVRSKTATIFQHDASESSLIEHKIDDFSLPQMEIRGRFKRAPHLGAIAHAIRLGSWRLNRRAARSIEQSKLNASTIDDAAHDAAERVDLAHEMSLRNSTNRGIARHLTDEIEIQRNQACFSAESRRGRRRLAARMASANHDYIECLIKRHFYFPMQNVANISDSISSVVVSPVICPRNFNALCSGTSTNSSLCRSRNATRAASSSRCVLHNRS